jgi:CRISPR-associated exonuclease Cas4
LPADHTTMTERPCIPVSRLVSASRCALMAFFSQNEPGIETPYYTICKQISYHLGDRLDRDLIRDEVCGILPGLKPEEEEFLESCISRCGVRQWRPAIEHDLFVTSRKYGICGNIDRVFSAPPFFSVVRSAPPPPAGIHGTDRLKIAAYAICLSESCGKTVPGGSIEYLRTGEDRYYEILPRDIRALYSARRSVQNLAAGRIPKKPVHASCSSCRYRERCDIGPTRLSDML